MKAGGRTSRTTPRALFRALAPALVAWHASAAPAEAQQAATCPDGRIGEIVIESQSVFDLSDPGAMGSRFSWAYRVANALHFRTRPAVVDRELLFEVGECYELEDLRDSERILRGFGFLANAEIFGVRQEDGSIQVVVDTQDEWSTRVQPKFDSRGRIELEGVVLSEDNLLGTGRHFSLFYDEEDDERVYGAAYSTPQFFRTRANMALSVGRSEVGDVIYQSVTYPFVGETDGEAFIQTIDRRDRYFEVLMPRPGGDLERLWVPMRREHFDLAAAFRRGAERYRHTVMGAGLAVERIRYLGEPIYADSVGRPAVPAAVFVMPWEPISSLRAVTMVGRRNVQFVRARGFDTVDGVEDVQLGYEGELSLGAAIPGLSADEDLSAGGRIAWAGQPSPRLTWGAHLSAEASHVFGPDIESVRDVLAQSGAWAYLKPRVEGRQTFVASVLAVGGWRSRVPFQLSLGGDTGLRGYPRHLDPGGRRIVGSLEHRAYLGWPFSDLLDLGSVAFVDVGKIWPGDVPFGTESPIRGTVGVGLRAAFPPGSRQTFRADIGLPVGGGGSLRSLVFSVGVGQAIGRRISRRDPQLYRSANYSLTSSDFLN